MKELLEKERIEALFSQARVLINGQEYPSKYFLMAPLDMLDVFDSTESIYVCETDSEGDEYIVSVDDLVLSKKINSDRKVFFVFVGSALDILVFRSDVAEKITEKGFRGMGFLPIINMRDG